LRLDQSRLRESLDRLRGYDGTKYAIRLPLDDSVARVVSRMHLPPGTRWQPPSSPRRCPDPAADAIWASAHADVPFDDRTRPERPRRLPSRGGGGPIGGVALTDDEDGTRAGGAWCCANTSGVPGVADSHGCSWQADAIPRPPLGASDAALSIRMERDCGSVTAAFQECRSAEGPDCAPADAWCSSTAGTRSAVPRAPARGAKQPPPPCRWRGARGAGGARRDLPWSSRWCGERAAAGLVPGGLRSWPCQLSIVVLLLDGL
jgi:hypothetical protein